MWKALGLLVLVATPASADAAGLFLEGGLGVVSEGGTPAPFVGLGALAPAGDTLALGARLRVHWTPLDFMDGGGAVLLAAARLRLPVAGPSSWVALGAGYGAWTGCFRGDDCGGGGATADAELGFELPIASTMKVAFTADLLAQTGMVNGVETMWVPSLSLALGI